MNDERIKNGINNAISQITPNILDSLLSTPINDTLDDTFKVIDTTYKGEIMEAKNNKRNNKKIIAIFSSLAACFVLVLGMGQYLVQNNVDSVISLDVNPSIQINTNKSDKIIDAIGVNDDGQKVLMDMDLKNVDLNIGVNAIIGSMLKNGYVADLNSILVSVQNDNSTKATTIKERLSSDITSTLAQNNVTATVYNQDIAPNEKLKQEAQNAKISYGKATMINNIIAKDNTLDFNTLANMSINDIAKLVRNKNIDISDIIDYDHDDSVQENLSEAVEEYNENSNNRPTSSTGNSVNSSNSNTNSYDNDDNDDKYDDDKYDNDINDDKYDNDINDDKYDDDINDDKYDDDIKDNDNDGDNDD